MRIGIPVAMLPLAVAAIAASLPADPRKAPGATDATHRREASARASFFALVLLAASMLSACGAATATATATVEDTVQQSAQAIDPSPIAASQPAPTAQAIDEHPPRSRSAERNSSATTAVTLGNEQCSLPGNYDSDGRIEVRADKLVGYEESSRPTDVRRLARSPMVWQINTTVNLGDGWEPDTAKIFVIAAGQLVMTDTDEVRIYTRCK